MDSARFVSNFRGACIRLMDAADQAKALMDQYGDVGDAVALDPYFNNSSPNVQDPLTKAQLIAAGTAITSILTTLGTGVASNRAKLNTLR